MNKNVKYILQFVCVLLLVIPTETDITTDTDTTTHTTMYQDSYDPEDPASSSTTPNHVETVESSSGDGLRTRLESMLLFILYSCIEIYHTLKKNILRCLNSILGVSVNMNKTFKSQP